MRLHETLAQFSDIVRRYEVMQYEVEGPHSRLKTRVLLVDGGQLHVRETGLDGQRRKYAYHWQDPAGVICGFVGIMPRTGRRSKPIPTTNIRSRRNLLLRGLSY